MFILFDLLPAVIYDSVDAVATGVAINRSRILNLNRFELTPTGALYGLTSLRKL